MKVKDGNKERTKLEPEPDQAGTVSAAFDSMLDGKGLIQIAQELNSTRVFPAPVEKAGARPVFTTY